MDFEDKSVICPSIPDSWLSRSDNGKKNKAKKNIPYVAKKAIRNVLTAETTAGGYANLHRTYFDVHLYKCQATMAALGQKISNLDAQLHQQEINDMIVFCLFEKTHIKLLGDKSM